MLEPHRKETEDEPGGTQELSSELMSTKFEANPILPAGKHSGFSSLFKEKLAESGGATNYGGRGLGMLPKLNTTFSPGNTRYGRLTVTYGDNWQMAAQRLSHNSASLSRSPDNDSK